MVYADIYAQYSVSLRQVMGNGDVFRHDHLMAVYKTHFSTRFLYLSIPSAEINVQSHIGNKVTTHEPNLIVPMEKLLSVSMLPPLSEGRCERRQ